LIIKRHRTNRIINENENVDENAPTTAGRKGNSKKVNQVSFLFSFFFTPQEKKMMEKNL
jgi:hypothetical protein